MSKSQKAAVFLLGLLLGVGAYYTLRSKNQDQPREAQSSVAQAQPSPQVSSQASAASTQEQAPKKESRPKEIRIDQPPSLARLRDEVKKDPHETPQALLRFGADLGVRMEKAKSDEGEAIKLLGELKTCADPATLDDSPVQARAICLVTAREIEQIWPGLSKSAEEIVSHADSKALELASKIGHFSH